jgi:hypothetical protein
MRKPGMGWDGQWGECVLERVAEPWIAARFGPEGRPEGHARRAPIPTITGEAQDSTPHGNQAAKLPM